jgi:hypothetical protein
VYTAPIEEHQLYEPPLIPPPSNMSTSVDPIAARLVQLSNADGDAEMYRGST